MDAWVVRKQPELQAQLETLEEEFLGDAPLTVDVAYSGINYKDALALGGKPGVVRSFPLVPGIDLVGTVRESTDPAWGAGDTVVITGAGLGEAHHGGLATVARVDPQGAVKLPEQFTPRQAAAIGTAGFTAALSVAALRGHGVDEGPVVVTGASGGVGSITVALLASLGYEVIAATGRLKEQEDYLRRLGASGVMPRDDLKSAKPLASGRWAGAVDAVGGEILAGVLAATRDGGAVAACGLAAGIEVPTTVMPFIIRGVNLLGIDSVRVAPERRTAAWKLLAEHLDPGLLDELTRVVPLAKAQEASRILLDGQGTGRIVVDVRS